MPWKARGRCCEHRVHYTEGLGQKHMELPPSWWPGGCGPPLSAPRNCQSVHALARDFLRIAASHPPPWDSFPPSLELVCICSYCGVGGEPGSLGLDSGSQLCDSLTLCSQASHLTSVGLSCPFCKLGCGKNQTRSQLKESSAQGRPSLVR